MSVKLWIEAKARQALLPILWERVDGICPLCANPLQHPLHVDHIIPRSAGGSDDMSNLQVTHRRCNVLKGDKPLTAELIERIRNAGTTGTGTLQIRPGPDLHSRLAKIAASEHRSLHQQILYMLGQAATAAEIAGPSVKNHRHNPDSRRTDQPG